MGFPNFFNLTHDYSGNQHVTLTFSVSGRAGEKIEVGDILTAKLMLAYGRLVKNYKL